MKNRFQPGFASGERTSWTDLGRDVLKPRVGSREREFKGSCQYLSKEFAFEDSKLCPSYVDVKLVSSFKVEVGRGGKCTWKIVGKSVGSSLKTKGICEERSKGNMERLSNMRHLSSHGCFLPDIPFPAPNLT